MDAKQALSKLRSLEAEDAAELASVLENALEAAEQKAFTTIGEKRTATQKNQALAETLEAIARGLDISGSVDELLDKLPGAVQDVRRSRDELTTKAETLETTLTEATTKVQTFERRGKLTEIAAAAGANAAVLERLFGDQIDTLAVVDGVAKLGDKPLREAVEADEALKAFAPALFVAAATQPTPAAKAPGKLPGGSPAAAKPTDPVAAYVGKAYGGAKALGLGNSATN
jgi:hypothetical protein